MKSGDLAKLLGVSAKTIRVWSDAYDDLLTVQKTKQRVFTEEDILVLSTVATLYHDGHSHPAIREKLDQGYRVEDPSVANFGVDTRVVPAAAVEQLIDGAEMRVELERITNERDRLLELLESERDENKSLKDENKELQVEIRELNKEIKALYERLLGKD